MKRFRANAAALCAFFTVAFAGFCQIAASSVPEKRTDVFSTGRVSGRLCGEVLEAGPAEDTCSIGKYDIVVARDGSGDFLTIQEAIDAAPYYCREATVIHIRPGVYREKVTVPANRQKIHLVGDDAMTTVICWDDYALKPDCYGNPMGTSATSTVFIYGDDFLAENITFENSAGEGKDIAQACAVTVDADRVAFIGCRFVANQDTVYTYGKGQHQYFRGCWIEGTTDFIFGASTAYFEDCTIFSKKDSYSTAASTPEGEPFGYVFRNCRLEAADGVTKVYLGRPWRPYARTVFIDCVMGGHIRPEGWHNWDKEYAEKTVFYAEYGSVGEGAGTSGRVEWSCRLERGEVSDYLPDNVLDAGAEIDKNGNIVPTEWFFKEIF